MVAQRSDLSNASARHDRQTRDTFKGAMLRTGGDRMDGVHSKNMTDRSSGTSVCAKDDVMPGNVFKFKCASSDLNSRVSLASLSSYYRKMRSLFSLRCSVIDSRMS